MSNVRDDDRVWQRWVEIHPYDADRTPEERAMLLDTFDGHALRLRIAAEDITGPAGVVARAMVARFDRRLRDLQHQALVQALRRTR